jgi:hypothetical protein
LINCDVNSMPSSTVASDAPVSKIVQKSGKVTVEGSGFDWGRRAC